MGTVLAEQHDEWAESRRYLGLDVLSKSRLTTDTPTEQETTPAAPPSSFIFRYKKNPVLSAVSARHVEFDQRGAARLEVLPSALDVQHRDARRRELSRDAFGRSGFGAFGTGQIEGHC